MKTNLSITHDASFWPFIPWADFARMTDRDRRVVIIPVVGMADWDLDAPLDFEECLTLSILKTALEGAVDNTRFLVIPPVRFTMGRPGQSCFTVDAETAHATLEDIVTSIHAHGFRKILFLNSSPWNEDLVDSAGRDLRIKLGVQPFCINLSSIGLDFQAEEARDRLIALRDCLLGPDGEPNGGTSLLQQAGTDLLSLLEEVRAFRPLPDDGAIPRKTYPL
jgi:creatinine amidohydrolase